MGSKHLTGVRKNATPTPKLPKEKDAQTKSFWDSFWDQVNENVKKCAQKPRPIFRSI